MNRLTVVVLHLNRVHFHIVVAPGDVCAIVPTYTAIVRPRVLDNLTD